ncbi:uncharacterized protein LOC132696834 isoform X2 [Cylas formicarius]|uniref:uncharacterized protein LOC132696834 isoform X2 n=1 Tax=Cylas formicarius TaxID=197179 RepID=UPI0029585206|nr:uncharacterized protein LOC132696834 isoform X2 [Cylas formicarius]
MFPWKWLNLLHINDYNDHECRKLLTVKGGCGNTVISLEPKQLTKKQRFGFLDGTHITSKCDPNSIVGLADNNETLTIKKNDPADYTKNKILLRHLYIPGL